MKAARAAFAGEERRKADEEIWRKVVSLPEYTASGRVFAYASFGSEIDTGRFLRRCLADGKELYLPRVTGKEMVFRRVRDLGVLVPGVFGIPEPDESCEAADLYAGTAAEKFVLMPGLAFDRERRRLGYGGGYYDRTFADCTDFFFCAAAYQIQIVGQVPAEEWDLKASVILTENETIS